MLVSNLIQKQPVSLPTMAPLLVVLVLAGLWASPASALPSYTRQTGVPCSQCHTIAFGPQLTSYGRQFKLNGYVWGGEKSTLPLALMTVLGTTHTSKDLTEAPEHYGTNDNFAMNELTGFLAGRLTKSVGAFVEVSYSGIERKVAWGAFDVRYARSGSLGSVGYVAGITINNNPTVTDLWNSTPVWSFPYTGSDLAPTPAAAPILFDGISERVLGPSVYAMFNNRYYFEVGAYKGMSDAWLKHVGLSAADNLHLDGMAPYWRAVMQFDSGLHSYSFGLLGLDAKLRPDPLSPLYDRYSDIGFDSTYQYSNGDNAVTANLVLVHERRRLAASEAAEASDALSNTLRSTRFDTTYAYKQTWVGSLGWFNTRGTTNEGLFAPADTDGSANGSPDSRGYTVQLEYVPFGKLDSLDKSWLNLRLGLQYTAYQKFNGGTRNYDGSGRSASSNDTLFAFAWLAL